MKALLRGIVALAFYTLSACGVGTVGEDVQEQATDVGVNEQNLVYTLKASADATVYSDSPNGNAGDATWLWVDGSPERRIFMLFRVPDLPSGIDRVYLALRVVDGGSSGALYSGSSSFSESTITWNNRPRLNQLLARGVTTSAGRWIYYPINITRAGTYVLALATTGSNGAGYASTETTAPPQLLFVRD
jgi:hypothetical protein